MRDELRQRVLEAVRVTGYAPNISARRLVQNKSFMVCILIYPGFTQPESSMLSSVMDLAYDENYDILIQPYFPTHKRSRNKLVAMIGERRIDGFVVTPPCDADDFLVDMLKTYKVPLVLINPVERTEKVPFIAGDDYQGAFAMTEHLISLGHRQIAFLMGPRNTRSSYDRLEGYLAALRANHLPQNPDLIKNSEYTFDGGSTAARLLLQQPARPTAIFAGSDEAAYGVIYTLQEMKVEIPGDLSVCGFGDLPFSKKIWPGLTTIHQPDDEMVVQATSLLIHILKNDAPQGQQILLPSRLALRGSTGPAHV